MIIFSTQIFLFLPALSFLSCAQCSPGLLIKFLGAFDCSGAVNHVEGGRYHFLYTWFDFYTNVYHTGYVDVQNPPHYTFDTRRGGNSNIDKRLGVSMKGIATRP